MAEETQVEAPKAPDTIQVVTSDTMQSFTEARTSGGEFKPEEAPKPEPQASAEEHEEVEHPTEETTGDDAIWKPTKDRPLSKKQIEANDRFSKATSARKEAEAKALRAEQDAAALRAKYEPAPTIQTEEPNPEKYTDAKAYAEDYANWKDGQRRMSEAAEANRRQAVAVQDRFNKDRDAFKATVPDWDARVEQKKDLQMHGEVIEAIMESDYPAQIMYELLPEDIARINDMPTMRARLKAIGRMEERIAKAGKEAAPEAKPAAKVAEVEVSRAPPPIAPIKATHQEPTNKVDKDGNFTGTQEEYEKYRRDGKIGAKFH